MRQSDLRFDVREKAIGRARSGRAAIVPGKPDESELVRRTFASEAGDLMPPPSAKLPLSEEEKRLLKAWIAAGAPYEPHWAFVAPVKKALPSVKDRSWPLNELDYFTLAQMERAGLKPAPPADRYALVRRLHLDLTGLPPTVEEADRFVRDESAGAYEALVDRLLASAHYGERWARRWLDLARYADTNGYEKDRPRSMWPYRNWVIDAFNRDMPFDRFTVEQIAGDMLPDATQDQRIATGFHRNTMINEEGGIDPLEYRFYAMVDRVQVTATTWLGLTMACAQCHSHKYDPITQEAYYQFMAFMDNADEPRMSVQDAAIADKRRAIEAEVQQLEADLITQFPPQRDIEWGAWVSIDPFQSDGGAQAECQKDGSLLVGGRPAEKDTYTLRFNTSQSKVDCLMLEVLTDASLPKGGPGRADNGNFVLSELTASVGSRESEDTPTEIAFSAVEVDHAQPGYPASHAIDSNTETGWAIAGIDPFNVTRSARFTFKEPVRSDGPAEWTVRLIQNHGSGHTLGRFRIRLGCDLDDERPMDLRRQAHFNERFACWLETEQQASVKWTRLEPLEAASESPHLTIESDGSVFAAGDFTKRDVYRVQLNGGETPIRALRLEVLADQRLPGGGPGTVHYEGPTGDFWLSSLRVVAGDHALAIESASQSYANGNNTAAQALDDDPQSGWSVGGGQGRDHSAVFRLRETLAAGEPFTIEMVFERYYAAGLGRFRIWATSLADAQASAHPNGIQTLLLQNAHSDQELRVLQQYFASVAPELAEQRAAIEALRKSKPEFPTTLVLQERPARHRRTTYLRHRGDYLQPDQRVDPSLPDVLPDLPSDAPRNRLGFARWLVSRDNPLTARVVVNRQWEALFGRGLVATTADFGVQGEMPSHPALLDWLAVEFMDRDWSLKALLKTIVMSATYRQSAQVTSTHLDRDPQNRWLSRASRQRLEAEMIRDSALVASGLLTERIGGPSVFPPQPASVTTEGAYGQLAWKTSEGPDRYRRSLYTYAKRTTPFAMLTTFDAPSGEACVARRDRSNTPLQSLTLLNDAMFMEMARALGGLIAQHDGSTEERLTYLFRRCLTRYPTSAEKETLMAFHEKQKQTFLSRSLSAAALLGADVDTDSADTAAWVALARVLMNLDEAVTKP